MADQKSLLKSLKTFAHSMGGSYDISEMSYQLSDSIAEALPADGAGVSVASEDSRLLFITATDERIVEIEKVQEKTQDGPCVDAFRKNSPVGVSDVDTDPRWPEYSRAASNAGIRAVVGYPLAYDGRPIGSIDVYGLEPREWTDENLDVLGVFADMATAYLVRMSELTEARRLGEQLQSALDSRVLIEQAKGLLAGDLNIGVDRAFELLRAHARNHNMKLAELCDSIVNDGVRLPQQ